MKILMVCLGNICRSPLAEGIMRKKLTDHNLEGEVDSCGFESFHVGDKPDRRAIQVALQHGVNISGHRGRQFRESDFDYFDKIYVMDSHNYSDVSGMARNKADLNKLDFIMNMVYPDSNMPVPDPYYGGSDGFETTWQLLDAATDKIIEDITRMQKS